jgi:hypothetical protein
VDVRAEEAAKKVILRVEMYPTQAKKRLEWATVNCVAALEWVFPQPVKPVRFTGGAQLDFPYREKPGFLFRKSGCMGYSLGGGGKGSLAVQGL